MDRLPKTPGPDIPNNPIYPQTSLRDPETVMRLDRMGSFFPTRLSFLRSLLRQLAAEKCTLSKQVVDLDDDGFGNVVLTVQLDGQDYSLMAFTAALAPEDRTDRVIAQAWDACFCLFDGVPTASDISTLRAHALKQEAGRYDSRVLVVSRANKSVRLFDQVVNCLSQGKQPSPEELLSTGYLMRTTAVYGNGKFGMADRSVISGRGSLSHPFRLEMLTVYLIREFTFILVNHVAQARGGAATIELNGNNKRLLGIGNSTGLGMAPFLVSHPVLFNNWMTVRETALARVRALDSATDQQCQVFSNLVGTTKTHLAQWNVPDQDEQARIETLRRDWEGFSNLLPDLMSQPMPFDQVVSASNAYSLDVQELAIALVLEPHADLIDGLVDCMSTDQEGRFDPTMTVTALSEILKENYDWALNVDFNAPGSRAMVWYVSEEKLEPRFGGRGEDHDPRQEMPHGIAQQVQALARDIKDFKSDYPVGVFVSLHPQHRSIVQRMQTIAHHPYGEIQNNLLDQSVRPLICCVVNYPFLGRPGSTQSLTAGPGLPSIKAHR